MNTFDYADILESAIAKYEREHGEPGLAKDDIDNMVLERGGDIDDIYSVLMLGMEFFFGDAKKRGQILN